MLESLNYIFKNSHKLIWVIYRIKQLRNYKKNYHGFLRGPQLGKQRWRARLGIVSVKYTTRSTYYPTLFCYEALHASGIFSAHHQEFSTVNSAVVSFMQVLITASKYSQDGTAIPSWLYLETVIDTCMKLTSAECTIENSWWWAEKMPETCRIL